MPKADILWPMGAMALLTFCVLGLMPIRRIGATWRKEITSDDFLYGESARVSGYVSIPNRSMMNLLELPVLFYVVCIVSYVTDNVGRTIVFLAWLCVSLRIAHASIHLSYNKVVHRLVAFILSNITLIAMWTVLYCRIVTS